MRIVGAEGGEKSAEVLAVGALARFDRITSAIPSPSCPKALLYQPQSTEVLKYISRLFRDDLGRLCSINAHRFDPLTTQFRKREVVAPLELARERFTGVLICV
jgi:hypothetical protein